MAKHRIRIIKIIVQLAMDQHGIKFPTKTEHDQSSQFNYRDSQKQ